MAVKRKSNKAMNEATEEVKTDVRAASGMGVGAAKNKSKPAGDGAGVAADRAAMMDVADGAGVAGEVVMTDGDDGAEVAGGVSGCAGCKAAMNNVTDRTSAAKDKSRAADEVKVAKGKAGGQKAVSAISPALVGAVCAALRNGLSLYAACRASGVDTRVFYQALADNPTAREAYRLALADYADRCTDAIRQIVAELRAGEIDNPTAKLLIETEKWLAQKACPEAVQESFLEEEERDGVKEIVVHFV